MTIVEHPLPAAMGFCALVRDFLSPEECRACIASAERRGFRSAEPDYPPSYRNNDRLVFDDDEIAGPLFRRLQPFAPAVLAAALPDAGTDEWRLDCLNRRLRFCRYRAGQRFNIHQDGVHYRGPDLRSRLTFMIYLTDGAEFSGGDTLFYDTGPASAREAEGAPPVVARIRPEAGMLILFDHAIWHAGETVTAGVKHILRSDLLYRRTGAVSASQEGPFSPPHEGYVWTMARLRDGRVASAGRDASIRLWSFAGDHVATLSGHRQSVLDLAQCAAERLASVSRDRSLRIWNTVSLRAEHTVAAHDAAVLAVAALPQGQLATGSADHCIKIWESTAAGTRATARLTGHSGWVWALASLGGGMLASASEDGTVKLWSTESRDCAATIAGDSPLRTLAVSPCGRILAAGDAAGWVTLWTGLPERAAELTRFRAHAAAVRRVRFFDENRLATAGEDNRIRIWRGPQVALIGEAGHDNFVTDLLPLDRGRYLSCSYDGRIIERHAAEPR